MKRPTVVLRTSPQLGAQRASQSPSAGVVGGGLDDGVLRVEAAEERRADQCQCADPHREVGDRHVLAQAAHVAHVLIMVHADDDRAGRQEQQRLEEGMGHKMENSAIPGPNAQRQKHIADLAHRGIRQNALDVGLHQCGKTGKQQGDRANNSDQQQDVWS
jgi:hypothetical protein